MRPTHIHVIGKSGLKFVHEIQPRLWKNMVFALVKRLNRGSTAIELSDAVDTAEAAEPLVAYLVRNGIPRADIRLRFTPQDGREVLGELLSRGLSASPLTFGPDVAERDDGLARYFITTSSFKAVEQHRRHIIVGPKGSGKSAILRELTARNTHSLVVTPEHYATEVLQTLRQNTVAGELAAYITTWKYTLLVEIFRRLVQQQIGESSGLNELRRYLVAHHHLDSDMTLFERFLAYLARISQVKGKVGPVEAEIGTDTADQLNKLFKMDELLGLVPALQRALRRTSFTVFIDELDQSWNNTDTANQFLISLLTAAIQLRGLAENLHIVVFLRSEIFELLKPYLPQLDKLRSDIEVIQWSKPELSNLITRRIVDSTHVGQATSDGVLRTVFPGTVDVAGLPTFDYILSRTSYRPREVIQFCNLALTAARKADRNAVDAQAALRAEEEFSVWKLEHVIAENMYIHPELDDLLERFRGKARRQSYHALDSTIADLLIATADTHPQPKWFTPDADPRDIIELLYKLEIIGIERVNHEDAASNRPWEAFDFVFTRPKGRPERSLSFLFHPGLWNALELT